MRYAGGSCDPDRLMENDAEDLRPDFDPTRHNGQYDQP
jgi:hypothetical protein